MHSDMSMKVLVVMIMALSQTTSAEACVNDKKLIDSRSALKSKFLHLCLHTMLNRSDSSKKATYYNKKDPSKISDARLLCMVHSNLSGPYTSNHLSESCMRKCCIQHGADSPRLQITLTNIVCERGTISMRSQR